MKRITPLLFLIPATACGAWTLDGSRTTPLPPRVDTIAALAIDRVTVAADGIDVAITARCGRDTVTRAHVVEVEHYRSQSMDPATSILVLFFAGSNVAAGGLTLLVSLVDKPANRDTERLVGTTLIGLPVAIGLAAWVAYLVEKGRTRDAGAIDDDVGHHVDPLPCAPPPASVQLDPPWDGATPIEATLDAVTHFRIDWLGAKIEATDVGPTRDTIGREWKVTADGFTAATFVPSDADVDALLAQLRRASGSTCLGCGR